MTERCQTKLREIFFNPNFIIYIGILCTSISVLYFYRFHLSTIALSYGLGCLASYYGLKSSIFHDYVEKLKCHFVGETRDKTLEDDLKKKCGACGSKDCERHNDGVTIEPWVGLQIHKQLDQAIEEFYNTIIDQFISSWYSKITLQPFFVDELRHQLRYASACLLQRALKIDYAEFITSRLVPCALQHYTTHVSASHDTRRIHPAARNRRSELNYLRCVCAELIPRLLRPGEYTNPVFSVLIREILSGWVLLPLTDILSDPHTVNTLIVLATGDENMAPLPLTPNYKVEFLETFTRQTDSIYSQRCKLLKIELDLVMSDQEYFYAFMQYLKPTCYIYLLQFYKDIKSFQTKLLNPELSSEEQQRLYREACDMYATYLDEGSAGRVPLHADIAAELYQILHSDDCIKRLQTSRALYQAARQSHAILDKIMLPKFLHSEEFYRLTIGSRMPTGYQKQMTKKPQERLLTSALKLGNKLKSALKNQAIDGQVLDLLANEDEGLDNVDILKYLDNLANEQSLEGEDLSKYKVVITDVETRVQPPPRRGSVRVFTLCVHRARARQVALWAARRSEHDFHLLRAKLAEFHGGGLPHLTLPSRRDNSPLETLRYKYEDFLQRLLQEPLLQTSELLRIFLTEDGEFSIAVQAATLNANSTDLVNIYQSVTHKLRKEKGQHLESFLKNLLVSSDIDRYQALKHPRDIEEATEVSEDVPAPKTRVAPRRDSRGIFGDNWAVYDTTVPDMDRQYQSVVVGFSQAVMFLLTRVIKTRSIIVKIAGAILGRAQTTIDAAFSRFLNVTLSRLLSETVLAHLIRLAHGQIFGKRPPSRAEPQPQRERAREQLLASAPVTFGAAFVPGLRAALAAAFDMLQRPELNKQLVYNLLDLCIAELFPELKPEQPSTRPKS